MDDIKQPGGFSDRRNNYAQLASWIQQVMRQDETQATHTTHTTHTEENGKELELLLDSDYHLRFYQQLPDFIMALLADEEQATLKYAPLLYHLAGCRECHASYLDLYDALQAAVSPLGPRPQLGQGTRTLNATPQRMLEHLCQSLISQAEALYRQERREHVANDVAARALLKLALSISARISQSMLRHRALRDLVRVANLFEGSVTEQHPDVHSYTPKLTGSARSGKKVLRRVDTPQRASGAPLEEPAIILQARSLEGAITQREQTLFLYLQDLAEELRGRYVTITVPLGALLEPVRWRGGNPRAIRSTVPVDAQGTLLTPLGETELQLSDSEEHNLLEAMFMLLEVR
ncbi:MAG TPA: hypothetical protein VGU68_04635, partial [Ktedonobacteraceae bacterium]|nr:hypothetical protein [Ktedonobacteraceae bacterium]